MLGVVVVVYHYQQYVLVINTDLTLKWKLRIYNAVFIPLVTYGLESAALTTSDYNRLEAFHSQSLRKILHLKSTYYTQVLQPTARTYTNQEVRFLNEQPPPSHTTSTKHN